jgi:hypothetical protein
MTPMSPISPNESYSCDLLTECFDDAAFDDGRIVVKRARFGKT